MTAALHHLQVYRIRSKILYVTHNIYFLVN